MNVVTSGDLFVNSSAMKLIALLFVLNVGITLTEAPSIVVAGLSYPFQAIVALVLIAQYQTWVHAVLVGQNKYLFEYGALIREIRKRTFVGQKLKVIFGRLSDQCSAGTAR